VPSFLPTLTHEEVTMKASPSAVSSAAVYLGIALFLALMIGLYVGYDQVGPALTRLVP
jgi:hypothetical protein